MTSEERNSIIAQLALVEGVNKLVFEKYTNDQLMEKMKLFYKSKD
jgi:hypothetical protein